MTQKMRYSEDGRPAESIRVDDYEGGIPGVSTVCTKDDPAKGAWTVAKQGFSTRRLQLQVHEHEHEHELPRWVRNREGAQIELP